MKQFFKFMFASMLGGFLLFLIVFFILVGIFSSLGKRDPKPITSNSVLHLTLTTEITDRTSENPFDGIDFSSFDASRAIGLNDLLLNIRKAKEDSNIEGIYLDLSLVQSGWASLYEIRNELIDFKESGKFIIAFGDFMSQGAYYLATVADEIYINPEGAIDLRGLNAEIMFVKNMLDKIGVEVQLLRAGRFKGAAEPLIQDRLSSENRLQIQSYISSLWNTALKGISEQRNIPVNALNDIADSYQARTAEGALEAGLIDGIRYRDEIMVMMREKLGLDENKEVNLVDYERYKRTPLPDSMLPVGKRDRIAVIYASGNFVLGRGSERSVGAERIAEAIGKARKDDSIKAIVLRINSPGGIALSGDIILREMILAGEAKPVVVSMGNVAASAGYYVAAYADKIIASPNTITGSIGVFGLIPNMQEMLNDKLGITFDNVKTNEMSDLGSVSRPLTRIEREVFEESIDRFYDTFIHHVAEGRGLPVERVDSIAQGRVWSGVDAKTIGLIDEFGGLNFAVEEAARLAGVEQYRVDEFPEIKDFFSRVMEGFGAAESRFMKARLGQGYHIIDRMQQSLESTGILMRMPYDVVIE